MQEAHHDQSEDTDTNLMTTSLHLKSTMPWWQRMEWSILFCCIQFFMEVSKRCSRTGLFVGRLPEKTTSGERLANSI